MLEMIVAAAKDRGAPDSVTFTMEDGDLVVLRRVEACLLSLIVGKTEIRIDYCRIAGRVQFRIVSTEMPEPKSVDAGGIN